MGTVSSFAPLQGEAADEWPLAPVRDGSREVLVAGKVWQLPKDWVQHTFASPPHPDIQNYPQEKLVRGLKEAR